LAIISPLSYSCEIKKGIEYDGNSYRGNRHHNSSGFRNLSLCDSLLCKDNVFLEKRNEKWGGKKRG
jgi:inhibitor of KinA sporulation pathway (predicted exonuclease)